MLQDVRIVIVGAGLMGGSLAKALGAQAKCLVAVDRDLATRDRIVQQGVAYEAVADLTDLTLDSDDLVILCTPVRFILETIEQLPQIAPNGCMVMDIGSTKWDICRAMNGLPGWFQAIGGHPMCGKETSGFGVSSAELYQNQTWIITPTVRTTPHLREIADEIVSIIGSNPIVMPPKDHDRVVALTSHLPYLIASTLMQQATNAADATDVLWNVSASGFRDTSRLSGSNPTMMRDILLTNRQAVVQQLLRFQRELASVVELVNDEDPDALAAWLDKNRQQHQNYKRVKEGD